MVRFPNLLIYINRCPPFLTVSQWLGGRGSGGIYFSPREKSQRLSSSNGQPGWDGRAYNSSVPEIVVIQCKGSGVCGASGVSRVSKLGARCWLRRSDQPNLRQPVSRTSGGSLNATAVWRGDFDENFVWSVLDNGRRFRFGLRHRERPRSTGRSCHDCS